MRTEAGLSQIDLAEAVGMERKAIVRLEAGQHQMRFDNLWALAEALGTRPSGLLARVEESLT